MTNYLITVKIWDKFNSNYILVLAWEYAKSRYEAMQQAEKLISERYPEAGWLRAIKAEVINKI
jgi:hypothetical protein